MTAGERPTVLIPTSRSHHRLVSYGVVMEFEDAMRERADADLIDVHAYSRRRRLHGALRGQFALPKVVPPREQYDLCFLAAMDGTWISSLGSIDRLRERCRRIVVYVFDAWLADVRWLRRYRREWRLCDTIYVSFPWAVDAYARELGRDVEYLPQAARAERFHPERAARPIDVLSVGRRFQGAHALLLDLAARRDLFYFYQEAVRPQAIDLRESQLLLARLCQSAKAQVSWPVELTNPARRSEGSAITARWFEAAACASIVFGREPADEEFRRLFPYDDFVLELDPEDEHGFERRVLEALEAYDREPRLELAEHVRTHHSWERRCETILADAGLAV